MASKTTAGMVCFKITVRVEDALGPIYTARATAIASNEGGASRDPVALYQARKAVPLILCCNAGDEGKPDPGPGMPKPTNYWRLVVSNFDPAIGPEFRKVIEIYIAQDEDILVPIT